LPLASCLLPCHNDNFQRQPTYLPGNNDKPMRDRLLNLPVMVALILSLVYRQIAGLSEAVRVLKEEGLLWVYNQ
jgi:hypothetical protein